MFSKSMINNMRGYTQEKAKNAKVIGYNYGGKLLAADVFEPGYDIFLNLHTIDVNSTSSSLHGHDFFEINYVIRGNCRQIIDNNREIRLHAGSVCIMNPNARHNIRVDSDKDLVLNISMKKSMFTATFWSLLEQNDQISQFFLDYFLALDNSSDFLLFELDRDNYVEQLLENICRDYLSRRSYSQVTMHCLLTLFFTEIIRLDNDKIISTRFTDKNTMRVIELFNYLSINYATATLSSTAEYFHYHPNYLSAFIKKHTGKTFRSILNDIKLTQADYYLAGTNMPIQQISDRLGFSQLCNFYDFIRRNHHMTPYQYRQMQSSQLMQ